MSVLTREDLLALVKIQARPCLSVYMCTDRLGAQTQQNPIRLKNLLRRAEESLTAVGLRVPEARAMLAPAYDLLQQSQFWRHMGDGMALFATREFFRSYRLPFNVDEQIIVNNRLHIRPLLPLLVGDGQFYVLALSQGGVRLYRCTRDSVSPVELLNVPANLDESRRADEAAGNLQFHTMAQSTGGPGGERAGMFYGTDMADNNLKREIVLYFHDVDRGLRETIRDEQAPLLLAGVEYLLPLYREANTYPALVKQEIPTGTVWLDAQELHDRAWPLVEPVFTSARRRALELFRQLTGEASGKASSDVREVVPAAYYGRVGTLLVAGDAEAWGRFDPGTGRVTGTEVGTTADDLVDLAAQFTLQRSGTVFTVNRDEMPGAAPVAALFRY